jgi:hypothetical protein
VQQKTELLISPPIKKTRWSSFTAQFRAQVSGYPTPLSTKSRPSFQHSRILTSLVASSKSKSFSSNEQLTNGQKMPRKSSPFAVTEKSRLFATQES